MTKRKVFFPSFDGTYKLAGVLTYPDGDPRDYGYMPAGSRAARPGFPVAILLYGWGDNKESKGYASIARNLAEAGIAFLRFDFQGHGESGGDAGLASVTTELSDTWAAMSFLEYRARKVDFNLGSAIVGVSVGGSVALAFLANWERRFNVRAGVLVSCRSDYHSNIKPGAFSFNNWLTGWRVVNRAMTRSGRSCDFYYLASRVSRPVLVLHGTEDKTVPIAQSLRLVEGRQNFWLCAIEGGDHALHGKHCDQAVDLASKFIITKLKPPLG